MTTSLKHPSRIVAASALLLLVVAGMLGSAETVLAQSSFALTNVGQKMDTDDARMTGRGGWGMAVHDSTNPGFKNTAGLSAVRHVVISLVGYGAGTTSKDASGERSVNRVMAPEFRLAVPIIKGRLAFTTGFSMDRSFRFDSVQLDTFSVRDHTVIAEQQFIRQGTIFDVPMGLAWEAVPGLSLGASIALVKGSLTESLYEIFVQPVNSVGSSFYKTVLEVQKDTFEGTVPTLSALYRKGDRVQIGASWTPAYDVDANRDLSVSGLNTKSTSSWSMTMPDEYLLGAQIRVRGRWLVGADYQMQAFSEFEGPQEWLDEGMEDEYTLSFGLEKKIAYERRAGLKNWPLRLGYSTRQWAYQVGGNPVTENTYSFGTGFPFRGRLGTMDLALSYSKIGDQAKNGIEDSVWKMSVSVTGLERWW
jgi:hypothetical protein